MAAALLGTVVYNVASAVEVYFPGTALFCMTNPGIPL